MSEKIDEFQRLLDGVEEKWRCLPKERQEYFDIETMKWVSRKPDGGVVIRSRPEEVSECEMQESYVQEHADWKAGSDCENSADESTAVQ